MRLIISIAIFMVLLAAAALPAASQQSPEVKRVGVLLSSPVSSSVYLAALRDGLRERGWIEGRNVAFEPRYNEGKPERLAELALELARLPLDAIVTAGVPPTRAVKQATQTIPIVAAAATDPAATGLVTPGGNVAAFDVLPPDAAAQQVALLRELVPALRRVALVWNGSNPASQLNARRVQKAAQVLALDVIPVEVAGPAQLDMSLANLQRQGAEAIFLVATPEFLAGQEGKRIGQLITATGLPSLCQEADYADRGCLIAYGANLAQVFHQSASYVDRILKGAHPGDLPIGMPTRFELAVNISTATAIGLTIPDPLLGRTDRRVE
jgi:putative tryptophan/tyrosine transport system substrate-binding protein